jgi:phenylpropionate dioxygenase-like ring-hydroxylating dioxygenase large terminal subunit
MINASVTYHQHYWSIISRIKDLKPNKINTFNFLGERIVVWKPYLSTKYSVFIDECPHCKGPLGTGYIDNLTETLVCSYHGCRFDTQGVCTHNPRAESPEFIAKNCYDNFSSKCMTVLETQEENACLMGLSPTTLPITYYFERLD